MVEFQGVLADLSDLWDNARSFPVYYNEYTMHKEKLAGILTILHQEMKKLLGEKLETIYLYGSQARGEAKANSDIDVLVVLTGDFDYAQMLDLTSDVVWKLSLENDIVISRVFISKFNFDQANTPFLLNVHREAVPV